MVGFTRLCLCPNILSNASSALDLQCSAVHPCIRPHFVFDFLQKRMFSAYQVFIQLAVHLFLPTPLLYPFLFILLLSKLLFIAASIKKRALPICLSKKNAHLNETMEGEIRWFLQWLERGNGGRNQIVKRLYRCIRLLSSTAQVCQVRLWQNKWLCHLKSKENTCAFWILYLFLLL